MTPMKIRRAVAASAAALGVVLAAMLMAPQPASADPTSPSEFDFSACPQLPAGLDHHTWRCEVHLATGEATVGGVNVPLGNLMITHAEGPLADGTSGQVFGALRSGVTTVPGGLTGTAAGDRIPQLRLSTETRYGGYADLIGNGPDPGGVYLALKLHNPLLGRSCSIGSVRDPIKTHMARVGATEVIPTDPPIRKFTLQDLAFAVPAAHGCGPLGPLVDHRFGLPSTAGNSITLHAAYTYKTYEQLGR
jgi:hypothetical protein